MVPPCRAYHSTNEIILSRMPPRPPWNHVHSKPTSEPLPTAFKPSSSNVNLYTEDINLISDNHSSKCNFAKRIPRLLVEIINKRITRSGVSVSRGPFWAVKHNLAAIMTASPMIKVFHTEGFLSASAHPRDWCDGGRRLWSRLQSALLDPVNGLLPTA
jgi:hypothetical protein